MGSQLRWAAFWLAAAEALSFLVLRLRARSWRRPLDFKRGDFPPHNRPPTELLRKMEEYMSRSKQHFESFLGSWCFGAEVANIQRSDAEELLAWAVFCRRAADLEPEERRLTVEALSRAEAKVGFALAQASRVAPPQGQQASKLRFCAHTWEEDCSYHYFPLALYVAIFLVHSVVDPVVLFFLGFRHHRRAGLSYWLRPGPGRGPAGGEAAAGAWPPWDAVVWLHGLSVGRIFYMNFVLRFRHETLLMVDMPWVAFNPLRTEVPRSADFCKGVAQVLDAHGLGPVCVVGHSYGSFAAAWMRFSPHLRGRLARFVLISGPALGLFLPKTCGTVLYGKPFWFEHNLAHVFLRQFFWYESYLAAEDLPKGSIVALSECDEMIPVEEVVRDCAENGVSFLVLPGLRHGFELFWPRSARRISRFVLERLYKGEPAPAPEPPPSLLAA